MSRGPHVLLTPQEVARVREFAASVLDGRIPVRGERGCDESILIKCDRALAYDESHPLRNPGKPISARLAPGS